MTSTKLTEQRHRCARTIAKDLVTLDALSKSYSFDGIVPFILLTGFFIDGSRLLDCLQNLSSHLYFIAASSKPSPNVLLPYSFTVQPRIFAFSFRRSVQKTGVPATCRALWRRSPLPQPRRRWHFERLRLRHWRGPTATPRA